MCYRSGIVVFSFVALVNEMASAHRRQRRIKALAPWRFLMRTISHAARIPLRIKRPRRSAQQPLASLTALAMLPDVGHVDGAQTTQPYNGIADGSMLELQRWLSQDTAVPRTATRSAFPISLRRLGECRSVKLKEAADYNCVDIGADQQLLTVGSRLWDHVLLGAGLLKVRIYDFGIYVDAQGAQKNALKPQHSSVGSAGSRLPPGFWQHMPSQQQRHVQHAWQSLCDMVGHTAGFSNQQSPDLSARTASMQNLPIRLKSSPDVAMTLVVRAARNLPIMMVAKEYESTLRRRIARVGGCWGDRAGALLRCTCKQGSAPKPLKALPCHDCLSQVAAGRPVRPLQA